MSLTTFLPRWGALGILCLYTAAHANITVMDYWRMGENDGATNGTVLSSTADSAGSKPLALVGTPVCVSNVSATAASSVGSSLALSFTNAGAYGTNALIPSIVDNFGIEVWVKPTDTSGNKCLAYNGDSGASGWGIYQVGTNFQGLYGNVTYFGAGTVTPGTWTHLAIVRNSGTSTLYVNGVASGSTTASTPNAPTGKFGVAATPGAPGAEQFNGVIDEVRYFTFPAGQFSPNDLLINAGAPVVASGIRSNLVSTAVQLNDTANPNGLSTTAFYQYGTTASYGSNTVPQTLPPAKSAALVATFVTGLTPGKLYHYHFVATNSAGTSTTSDSTFTTPAAAPSVTTQPATGLTTTTATLNALINPNGAVTAFSFQYGPTTSYGSSSVTNPLASGNVSVSTNCTITGLTPGTLYHFRAVAGNSAGNATGTDLMFTTPTSIPPQVTTQPANSITSVGATVNGLVNPNGFTSAAWFQWGTTTSYGNTTAAVGLGNGSSAIAVSNVFLGLNINTVYHFRCVATNVAGTTLGLDQSFTTPVTDVTALHYYHLGEADSGATNGGVVTSTHDSVGGQDLAISGSPVYTTNVSSGAAQNANSTLAIDFSNGRASGPVLSTLTDNFGLEAWVYPTSASGSQTVAYNGNSGSSGWGIFDDNGTFRVLYGGVEVIGGGPAPLNQWTHVALVRDSGMATLYVNGVASGSSPDAPNTPAGGFGLAAYPDGSSMLSGVLDEVRLFTFAPGTFNTNDLLLNAEAPPSITNVLASGTSTSGATLNATVSANGANATVWFLYGTTTGYGSVSAAKTASTGGATNISTAIAGLTPDTTYHFQAVASNSVGVATSADYTFYSAAVPAVTTLTASNIAATSATLSISVNPGGATTTAYFEYGLTTNYTATSSSIGFSGGTTQTGSNNITGLAPGATYHFQAVAQNSAGLGFGGDLSFTTLPAPPTVTTLAATMVRTNRATANGSVNPNGGDSLAWFAYGLTTNYGNLSSVSSIPAGATMLFSNFLTGLMLTNTYHYCAVASNSAGITFGNDLTLTTPFVNVTNLLYCRLGEVDLGAAAGVQPTTTSNSAGGFSFLNLTVSHTATPQPWAFYSTDVASGAYRKTRSSLSLDVHNGFAYSSFDLTAVDNFLLELWAKPTDYPGDGIIAWSGTTHANGWGLEQMGGTIFATFGNRDGLGDITPFQWASTPMVPNQWVHLAIVRNQGVATFYVNGVPTGTTTYTPATIVNRFALSAYPDSPAFGRFPGLLDEVRVAVFKPGIFDPSDLLYAAPMPNPTAQMTNGQFQLSFTGSTNDTFTVLASTNLALPMSNWPAILQSVSSTDGTFNLNIPLTNNSSYFRLSTP